MRLALILLLLLPTFTLANNDTPKPGEREKALSAFVGHWEGSANFLATRMSEASKISSVLDCAWSPQQQTLVCDQTITDPKGVHHQLTIYVPNESAANYTYYTFTTPGKAPYMGVLTIQGAVWTYKGPPESSGKFPEFRTTNAFKNAEETFRVEFTENGTDWTLMLEGTMHRTKQ